MSYTHRMIDDTIAEKTIETVESNNKVTTKELAEKLEEHGVGGFSYIKVRLHQAREYIPENYPKIQTMKEEDNTGGDKTRYWKVEEN